MPYPPPESPTWKNHEENHEKCPRIMELPDIIALFDASEAQRLPEAREALYS
jgi:hypothetical protein